MSSSKKTKMLRTILYPLVGALIPYLPVSFYYLSFNPYTWSNDGRLFYSMFGTILFIVCFVFAKIINCDDKLEKELEEL